jgi:hypothetical protein
MTLLAQEHCQIPRQKSGRSSGLRLEAKWRSTTTAWSSRIAPTFYHIDLAVNA